MSSALAINRPQPKDDSMFLHDSEPSISSGCTKGDVERSTPSIEVRTSSAETFTKSELEERLREALRDRDEQWRRHERSQITFLQNEGAYMLKGLHEEVERLSNFLRDARRKLDVGDDEVSDKEQMRSTIEEQAERIAILENALAQKEVSLADIERKVKNMMDKMNETIKIQSDRIRQLTGELSDRTLSVTQLSGQLRQYRLREAMATAYHRRRASQQNQSSPPLASPNSSHRIFPPKSPVTGASVSITFPGNSSKSSAVMNSSLIDISCENPKATAQSRRKSVGVFSSIFKN